MGLNNAINVENICDLCRVYGSPHTIGYVGGVCVWRGGVGGGTWWEFCLLCPATPREGGG